MYQVVRFLRVLNPLFLGGGQYGCVLTRLILRGGQYDRKCNCQRFNGLQLTPCLPLLDADQPSRAREVNIGESVFGAGREVHRQPVLPGAKAVRFLHAASGLGRNDRVIVTVLGRNDSVSIVAYFALLPSPEPTYSHIDGAWLTDEPYGVIHRIASYPEVHGIFSAIIDFAAARYPHLRIDTHRDNRIMQHLIDAAGFTYCGIIWLEDGTERLAYEK